MARNTLTFTELQDSKTLSPLIDGRTRLAKQMLTKANEFLEDIPGTPTAQQIELAKNAGIISALVDQYTRQAIDGKLTREATFIRLLQTQRIYLTELRKSIRPTEDINRRHPKIPRNPLESYE